MMIAFQQLDIPRPAGNEGKWVVMTKKDRFLVLLKTGELDYGPDYIPEDYQFDTEVDAFIASAHYYNQNLGRSYPHIARMLEVLDTKPLVFDENDEESQPMEFK